MRFFEAIHGVYFDDLDGFQILHNSRYLVLFERTIGAFWQRLGYTGNFAADANRDQLHLVRSNTIEYLRPVDGVGDVRVRVWVEKLGRSSLVLAFRVLPMEEDLDFATGNRAIVHVTLPERKPLPWSDDFRKRIAPYVKSGETPAGLDGLDAGHQATGCRLQPEKLGRTATLTLAVA